MKPWPAFLAIALAACSDLGAEAFSSGNLSTVNPMRLALVEPRSNTTVKFLVPGSSGPPTVKSQIVEVPAKLAVYGVANPANDTLARVRFPILAVNNPYTKKTCVITGYNGSNGYYVTNASGNLQNYTFGSGIMWRESFIELPTVQGSVDTAIARFDTDFDAEKLMQIERQAVFSPDINLISAASDYYFSDEPGAGGGDAGAKIESLDLTDGVLRMDVRNPITKMPATFWVDLKAKKVIKSVVNGQEMDLTTGKPFAVPLKKN